MSRHFFDAVPLSELQIRAEQERFDVTTWSEKEIVLRAGEMHYSFQARVRDEFAAQARALAGFVLAGDRATVISGTVALSAIVDELALLSSSPRERPGATVRGEFTQGSLELEEAFSGASRALEIRGCPLWLVVGEPTTKALQFLSAHPSNLAALQLRRAVAMAQEASRGAMTAELALRFALGKPSKGAPKSTSGEAGADHQKFRSRIAVGRFLALPKKGDT